MTARSDSETCAATAMSEQANNRVALSLASHVHETHGHILQELQSLEVKLHVALPTQDHALDDHS